MKASRWYKITDGMLHVFDEPFETQSRSVSVVGLADFKFYRANFYLRKCWG